jgi:hypothetical protein
MSDDMPGWRLRVRTARCASCLYRLHYDRRTRERVLGDARANDGYVQCHDHAGAAKVCCRGYWDAVGEQGCTIVQIAIRLLRAGHDVVEFVPPGRYPAGDDEDEEPDERIPCGD